MEKLAAIFAVAVVGLILVLGVVGYRAFSSAATTISVVQVEPGVRCAKAVTGDGVALSCWAVPR